MSTKTQHSNIIKVMEIIYHEATPVVITELLPSGNLYEALYQRQPLISGIPGDTAVSVMRQLLGVVRYLHELDIVHQSIKLNNLLIGSQDPLQIKLTGFELATSVTLHSPFLAMSGHIAPEVWEHHFRDGNGPQVWDDMLKKRGHLTTRPRPRPGKPVDIWSCGAICCELTLETTPQYLNCSKSQDEQAAVYVGYILTAEKVKPAKRAEVWAEQLKLPLNLLEVALWTH
ncbi:MAG: hypothetical protein FRX48_00434 [Lasallia pustulata]|uniref:Protein kinase domain-containing protein n=1 Tax=Lasallia pustulata TaxID=136370 RepID=A0A5M8Q0P3_9LECA|nr:MAG: hypothetical protein FRX48_00434 [Lasallia pustulata]